MRKRAAALAALFLTAAAPPRIDAGRVLAERFGADADWYRDRVPLFESGDPLLTRIYYYRWQVVRAHQRDLGAPGYVTTEFLDDVGWQKEPYATLNDATGFHLGELRWLRDRRYAADYLDHMYTGGNDRHFTDYMADAAWSRYLVDGDRTEALRHLGAMRLLFGQWDDRLDRARGLYWIEPLLDATEYTVSSIDASGGRDGFRGGDAFRPSINAYMFANARAIARLSRLAGDPMAAEWYEARAADIRMRTVRDLWNPDLGHFADRFKVSNEHVRTWQPVRARELVGFVPWAFDLPPDEPRYAAAWRHLLDRTVFAGAAGPRTVEPRYRYYLRQYRYEGRAPECQWNGPSWPFQTTQVLLGMANLLDHYAHAPVTRADYLALLRQYARLHLQGDRPDLQEDYHPESGAPIVGLARSHHYFHSGFVDLVMTGLVGIRPRADDVLEVSPLVPADGPGGLAWFRVQDVPYHGRLVSVTWDLDGRHYGAGRGLRVEVDGRVAASGPTAARLLVPLPRRAPPPIERPLNLAAQVERGAFPRPSASANADPEALHDALDGRTWFFPEAVNGWTIPIREPSWFEVDLGRDMRVSRAELALFADGALPARFYRLQYRAGDRWRDVDAEAAPARANGVAEARWRPVAARRWRVLFRAPRRTARLVELKLF